MGVNTTTPAYTLDVRGTTNLDDTARIGNKLTLPGSNNTSGILVELSNPAANYIVYDCPGLPNGYIGWSQGTTNAIQTGPTGLAASTFVVARQYGNVYSAIVADSQNRVGINCNVPVYGLDVFGTIHGTSALIDTTVGIGMPARNSYKLDVSGNAEITNVLNVGNSLGVGPGTFGSAYTLDVNGGANISGRLNVTSTIVANGDSALIGLPSMLVAGPNAAIQLGQIGTKRAMINFCTTHGYVWGMGVLSTTTQMYGGASPSTLIIGGLGTNETPGLSINNVGANAMRVGVNNPTPQYTLDVAGTTNITTAAATAPILQVTNTKTDSTGGVFADFGSTAGRKIRMADELASFNGPSITFYSATTKPGILQTGSVNSLSLLPANQCVGVNTTVPQYALDVTGSIRTTGTLFAAQDVSVSSDERIKKNIVDATSALDIISSIKLRSFDYKDPDISTHVSHGVIAQEVRAVYPEAIRTHNDMIPSILAETTIVTKHKDGTLLLVLPSAHGLLVNDFVSLKLQPTLDASGAVALNAALQPIFAGITFETRVLKVNSTTTFNVEAWPLFETDPERKVLVIGKRVNDFLSVDKAVLGLLALGGVQELVAQHKELLAHHQETVSSLAGVSNMVSTLVGSAAAGPTGATEGAAAAGATGATEGAAAAGATGPTEGAAAESLPIQSVSTIAEMSTIV